MALMRTMMKPNLVNGIRCYDPVFKPSVKKHNNTIYNFTSNKIYEQLLETFDKPPRMHSFFIPKWKMIRKWQAEASIDLGLPAYKRFPLFATSYRFMWTVAIFNLIMAQYKGFCYRRHVILSYSLIVCVVLPPRCNMFREYKIVSAANKYLTNETTLSMSPQLQPSYLRVLARKIERIRLAFLLERKPVHHPALRRRTWILGFGWATVVGNAVYCIIYGRSNSSS